MYDDICKAAELRVGEATLPRRLHFHNCLKLEFLRLCQFVFMIFSSARIFWLCVDAVYDHVLVWDGEAQDTFVQDTLFLSPVAECFEFAVLVLSLE